MSNTSQEVTYTFDDFADMFVELSAFGSPSELHGFMCGQLSAAVRVSTGEFLAISLAHLDVQTIEDEADKAELINLYDQTLTQLTSGEFSIQLLLPEDDHDLSSRVEALASWCSGFLAGFGLGFDRSKQNLSDEITEVIDDLAEIAKVTFNADDQDSNEGDDTGEESYMELTEFVRMAAILVFTEYNNPESSSSPSGGSSMRVH